MRIEEIRIENFGALSGLHQTFTPGLNELVRENGWGKSTLAVFIRVMFYGFSGEGKRRNAELTNERLRYRPWQGGAYGGSLTFSVGERCYRIERRFGERPRQDVFALYDARTNLRSEDYGPDIGQTLFSVNALSFVNTAFIGQLQCAAEVTPEVGAKIGQVSEDVADMAGYDRAMRALAERGNRLAENRRTSELSQLRSQVEEGERQLLERAALRRQEEELLSQRAERQEHREDLRAQREALGAQRERESALAAERRTQEALEREAEEAGETLQRERSFFPGEVPSQEEVLHLRQEAGGEDGLAVNSRLLAQSALSPAQEEELSRLEANFPGGLPGQEEQEALRQDIRELEELSRAQQAQGLSARERQTLGMLQERFAAGAPKERVIRQELSRWQESLRREQELAGRRAALAGPPRQERESGPEKEKKAGSSGVLMALGIALLVLGLVLGALVRPVLFVLAVAGAALIFVSRGGGRGDAAGKGGDVRDAAGKTTDQDRRQALQEEIRAEEEAVSQQREQVLAFLDRYGCPAREERAQESLYALLQDRATWETLRRRDRQVRESDAAQRITLLQEKLQAAFAGYGVPAREGDYAGAQAALVRSAERYRQLSERRERADRAQERIAAIRQEVTDFLARYLPGRELPQDGQIPPLLDEVLSQLQGLSQAKEQDSRRRAALTAFLSEHGDELQAPEVTLQELGERIDALDAELEGLARQLDDTGRDLSLVQERLAALADREAELQEQRDHLASLRHEARIVSLTAKYLEEARNRFLLRYARPLQQSFDDYYARMTGEAENPFTIGADLSMITRQQGISHDIGVLSAGSLDLVSLCRRLAVVDAMYPGEKPFLLMDDPFVNLDSERLERGKVFLRGVAERYQVLYLTCHESRRIGERPDVEA